MAYRYHLGLIVIGTVAVSLLLGGAGSHRVTLVSVPSEKGAAVAEKNPVAGEPLNLAIPTSGEGVKRYAPESEWIPSVASSVESVAKLGDQQSRQASIAPSAGVIGSIETPRELGVIAGRSASACRWLPDFNASEASPAPSALFLLGGLALLLGIAGQFHVPASSLSRQEPESSRD